MGKPNVRFTVLWITLLLCGACDPVNEIRRDFTTAEPIGDACVLSAIETLISADPQAKVTVIPTPREGVEEILVRTKETGISCILSSDDRFLQLTYLSMGGVSEAEIQATKKLLANVEAGIRRSCTAAESMELVSEACTRMNCQIRSP